MALLRTASIIVLLIMGTGCDAFKVKKNCYNPKDDCFSSIADSMAPSIVSVNPDPNDGNINSLTVMDIEFSEELKDRETLSNYTVTTSNGDLTLESAEISSKTSVRLGFSGRVGTSGTLSVTVNLTDYSVEGLSIAGNTIEFEVGADAPDVPPGSYIALGQTLRITYPAMITTMPDVTASAGSVELATATTNVEDDTLTIRPESDWVEGNLSLNITGARIAGRVDPREDLSLAYQVFNGAGQGYYVSADGDDAETGTTPATARASLQSTVDLLAADTGVSKPLTIFVAAGEYEVNFDDATHLVLREGISLYGGFTGNYSGRTLQSSTIRELSTGAAAIVECGAGTTTATAFDGFSLTNTGNTDTFKHIVCSNASATIRNNIFDTAANDEPAIFTIFLNNSDSLVTANTIRTGGWSGSSVEAYDTVGIWTQNGSEPDIIGNDITVSSSSNMAAVVINGGSANIRGNNIYAPSSGVPGHNASALVLDATASTVVGNRIAASIFLMQPTYAINGINGDNSTIANNMIFTGNTIDTASLESGYGIRLFDNDEMTNSTTIIGNTILLGDDESGSGINRPFGITLADSTADVQNNLFLAATDEMGVCLLKGDASAAPLTYRNNALTSLCTFYFDLAGATEYTNIGDTVDIQGGSGTMTSFGNFEYTELPASFLASFAGGDTEPFVLGDNDWLLTAATPCRIVEGGLDVSLIDIGFGIDFSGNLRSTGVTCSPGNVGAAGYSVGAFER